MDFSLDWPICSFLVVMSKHGLFVGEEGQAEENVYRAWRFVSLPLAMGFMQVLAKSPEYEGWQLLQITSSGAYYALNREGPVSKSLVTLKRSAIQAVRYG